MKIKTELHKLLISVLFSAFLVLYYNTSHFRSSIVDGLYTTIFEMFDGFQTFFVGMFLYLIGYLLFNLNYICIHLLLKYLKIRKNTMIVTSLLIFIIISIYVVNDQLIISSLKDYKHSNIYFTPINTVQSDIDSTNYHQYAWEKKSIESSYPNYVCDEKIIFNQDSTFTLIGNKIVLDRLFLFRKLFNLQHKYEIKRIYEHKNITVAIKIRDSSISYCPLQIRDNRLYLNTTFY